MRKWHGLAVCGGVVAALAVATPAGALGPIHHQTQRATVHGIVTALSVHGEVGDITVVPGSVTRIVAIERYNLSAPELTHTLSDGLLRVAAPCPRPTGVVALGLNNCSVDFVITVPRAVTVDATDNVGDIRVRDLRGPESLRTDVGAVVVDGVVAPTLSAFSDAGVVRIAGVRARSLALRTSSGDIRADLAASPRRVVAHSSDGDVALDVPAGTYAVDTHTDVGATRVRGITVESDAPHRLSAHTDDGDIRISGK